MVIQPTTQSKWQAMQLDEELAELLNAAPSITIPESKEDLIELSLGNTGADSFEVKYDVPGKGEVAEALVHRVKNGVAVNYPDPYMRRRDPESMIIGDDNPTDKTHFSERFNHSFENFKADVFTWLKGQDLILLPFISGDKALGCESLLVAPANASFFAAALAEIQGMVPLSKVREGFSPRATIYLAPVFRHTMCEGRQVVVHNREQDNHEIFSLNLYPGPSAKKGIYGVLLSIGEKEGWLTAHGSTVQVTTPYDNELTILHEGASGGGKSEMLQYPHREPDGRLLLGRNLITEKKRYIPAFQGCSLKPVTDDMALCHTPEPKDLYEKLVVKDAEKGWFVRVDHITGYGVDPNVEVLCTNPNEPLVFLNIYSVPQATCLIWEHTEDEPGKPCPNPRVILPRRIVPDIVDGTVEVDVRSFGVRTPPCTKENPTYGIFGVLHLTPPALAWLWRLVSPRGHGNPSISDTGGGMKSEGVGSYWPFATGRQVDQANLLLKQLQYTPRTRYVVIPNQHIGAWKVGFMPQWIAREYLARRGSAKFKPEQLSEARCPLLGYELNNMQVEGVTITQEFLKVYKQDEVGEEAYDAGAKILTDFFANQLDSYLKESDLDPLGRKIIECFKDGGSVVDYEQLM